MNIEELGKPLNPDAVMVGDSGPLRGVKYITGQYAIETANRIFGFGGWGFELIGQPWIVEASEQGNNSTPYEVWAAAGRLTVKDCQSFADVGTCVRQGKGSGGLEMAIKGAVTDCLKRCLRNYGDQFGLVLYEKGLTMADLEHEYRGESVTQQPAGFHQGPRPAPPPTDESLDVKWSVFLAQCKGFGISTRLICSELGFEPTSAEEAATWMKEQGPQALDVWEKREQQRDPARNWSNLVSRLADRKAAAT